MREVLSQLIRKPSKATDLELKVTRWEDKQTRVLEHLEKDQVLQQLLEDFSEANDHLRYIRSTRDVKIYYTEMIKAGESYTYARCVFNVNGKQKEFRKCLGNTATLKTVDEEQLKKIFLKMLKNFLD